MHVSAFMASWYLMKDDKRLKEIMRARDFTAGEWTPITILDCGVFSYMRKAGVTHQTQLSTRKDQPVDNWRTFLAYAQTYVEYLRDHASDWDWVIELDVDELFGVDAADAFRRQLRKLVGDKLLPVWHGQRGDDGWKYLVHEYPYICLSPSKATGSRRSAQTSRLFRDMVDYAHEHGTRVHVLGDASYSGFVEYGHDSGDASSWVGDRWGNVGLPKGGTVHVSLKGKGGFAPLESQRREIEALCAEYGYEFTDMLKGAHAIRTLNLAMLMLRERYLRERARRLRGEPATV